MNKNYLYLILVVLLCFSITGCKKKSYCEINGHDFSKPTCTETATCNICGETGDPALGHEYSEATCLNYATCERCGDTTGELAEHKFSEATCSLPATCIECGETKGEPLGHNYSEATCTTPATCTICGSTKAGLGDHVYDYPCDTHCNECNAYRQTNDHNWVEATIDEAKHCSDCGKTEGNDLLTDAFNAIVPEATVSKVNLPSTILGYNVVWETTDNDVILNDGVIVSNSEDRTASLIATIDVDGTTYTKEKEIKVKKFAVATGTYDYAYNYFVTKLNKPISKDVVLITRPYNECDVRYISMDESIITSNGVITQTKVDQTTIMKVYVIRNGIALIYNTELTITAFTPSTRINNVKSDVDSCVEQFRNGQISVLPTYYEEYEVSVEWIANNPEFVMTETIHITPLEKTDLKLKAILSYEDTSLEATYELENIGGLISKDEFINELLKYMAEVELLGSINHLHPEYNNELFLDYQERTNRYGVLNLAQATDLGINRDLIIDISRTDFVNKFCSGLKPTPSQTLLDEIFYEGYQKPNDDNVLFITVHESAMTTSGHNAKYLAQIQYRYAFEQENAREASWHYQIDAYDIYQSWEDNIYGWHAGETYGNRYGIGIEMCVNSDGNYEGTIANNAKLVASLMLKYNLNFDNVYRHYDHSGKECPSYLIRTNRWYEFVGMVGKEYLIRKYFAGVTINYELSTDTYNTTEEVLDKYFITGDNGLYYNKPVNDYVNVNFTINVKLDGKNYSVTSSFGLIPDSADNNVE